MQPFPGGPPGSGRGRGQPMMPPGSFVPRQAPMMPPYGMRGMQPFGGAPHMMQPPIHPMQPRRPRPAQSHPQPVQQTAPTGRVTKTSTATF